MRRDVTNHSDDVPATRSEPVGVAPQLQDPAQSLFIYGSMLDEDVLELVLGHRLRADQRRSAELCGFCVLRVPGETYPLLSPRPDASLRGAVLSGLTETDWARVQYFESFEYALKPCVVHLENGEEMEVLHCAEAAIPGEACEPWELSWWQANHKTKFIGMVGPFMALFGKSTLDEAEALWERLCREADSGR